MEMTTVQVNRVTYVQGDRTNTAMMIEIFDNYERFSDGVPVDLSDDELAETPTHLFETGILTKQVVDRPVIGGE